MGYGARKSIEIAQREDAEFVDKSPSRGTAGEPREGEEEEEEGIDEGNMVPSSASSESGLVTVLKESFISRMFGGGHRGGGKKANH